MEKRGISPIAVMVIVMLTILLFTSAWFKSFQRAESFQTKLTGVEGLEGTYSRAGFIDKRIENMVVSANQAIGEEKTRERFLEEFEKELDKNSLEVFPEFRAIYGQIDSGNVVSGNVVENEKGFGISLKIQVEKEKGDGERKGIKVVYVYERLFSP